MYLVLTLASCDADGIASSVMHLLAQDDQNEVQHNFFGHATPLALVVASHDVNGIKMAPLHSLYQNNQDEVQHDTLVI